MKQQSLQKKDTPDEENTITVSAAEPATANSSLEEALLACMPTGAPKVASNHANAARVHDDDDDDDDDVHQVNTALQTDDDVVVPRTTLARCTLPLNLQNAALISRPGAYQVPAYVDPLNIDVEDEEDQPTNSEVATIDVEREEQQQSTQSNIVSAYRVAEELPPIIATPFKDNKIRVLVYGVLITAAVVALTVGLSFGLTSKSKEAANEQTSEPVDRLVSSVNVTADLEGVYVRGDRYIRTENGRKVVSTNGSAVVNYCEVVPCVEEGGCDLLSYGKVYKPGCCRGDDCDPKDKCGSLCPDRRNLCQPSYVGCTDPYCYDCKQGPNGEELYAYRRASFDMKCLRTGVAIGFDDNDDTVERFYKWAIVCGVITGGGAQYQNLAMGEYLCGALRIGDGITKTMSQIVPCQIIQLAECGCAPDDVHTLGLPLPPPDKPCKTKDDCQYLCGDAGEEEARSLCDAFPGIEWWEGENALYEPFFTKPEDNFLVVYSNVTIQIDIKGE